MAPSSKLVAKALRLVDSRWVRPSGTGYRVRGDSGTTYELTWHRKREQWLCQCNAHTYPCSHVLAVEEYQRREKEQTMSDQTTMTPDEQAAANAAPHVPKVQMVAAQTQAMTPQTYHGEPEGDQLDSIIKISSKLSKSGLFRTRRKVGDKWIEEYASEADVFMIALSGIDFGLSAAASARHLKMIQGALSVSAELMRARLHQFGYEYDLEISPTIVGFPVKSFQGYGNNRREIEKQQKGPESITVHLWRRANPETRWSATYTIAEAVQAGLTKGEGGWDKNPEDMLVARGTTRVVRRYAPEILNKAYLPEELGFYEEADGNEGTRLVEVQVDDVPTSSAAPPPHDTETGEIQEGEFSAEETPEPDPDAVEAAGGETHVLTSPPHEGGNTDAEIAEAIAEPWHWPALPEVKCREVMTELGYGAEKNDEEIAAVTNDIMLRALVARLKTEKAQKTEQDFDFDGSERTDAGRVDDPPQDQPFGDEAAPGAPESAPQPQVAPEVSPEEAEAWVALWASASAAVDGETVPEELVTAIGRKDSWRKYMMTELGVNWGEQEQLCRRFELPGPEGLDRGQRLGLIWWAEKQREATG